MIKLIKTHEDHETALSEVEALIEQHPEPGTEDADRLELLAFLVSAFESEHYPIDRPTPIEAIRFKMEQLELTQRDLAPYLGGSSRVSEVLSGKRSLSIKMVRALNEHLGIPTDILVQEEFPVQGEDERAVEWRRFPVKVMEERHWFPDERTGPSKPAERSQELVSSLFRRARITEVRPALLRQRVRSGSAMDAYALAAWTARVTELARSQSLLGSYESGCIDDTFMTNLVKVSIYSDGPRLARESLSRKGVHLVLLQHLPRTHLDGAAFMLDDGSPVVAMTLRYDRLDNFWFCLFHELGHVALHLGEADGRPYFDDLKVAGDTKEEEADEFADRALIPSGKWNHTSARHHPDRASVERFADQIGVHPAIVAGRVRKERDNYRILWSLVGKRDVRRHFLGFESGVA